MMAAIFGVYMLIIWLIFAKLKLIRLSLPIAVILAAVGPGFAFFILLSMNNYHPSSSDARVFQRIVQIVPHITTPGRVEEIVAQPNTPIKKGDVIFKIDPQSFQFEVDRLQAALAAAQQNVPQLKSSLDQASAGVEKATAQLNLAKADLERQQELFAKQVIAKAALDRVSRDAETARTGVVEARAAEDRARLAYQSNIGSDNTAVAQVRQQLAAAKYNLDELIVRAPCDGYAVNLQLVPGAVVSAAASVLPFVCDRDERNLGMVVATFMQGPLPSDQTRRICRSHISDVSRPCVSRQGGHHHRRRQRRAVDGNRSVSRYRQSRQRTICRSHPARRRGRIEIAGRHAGRRRDLQRQRADCRHHTHGADAGDELDQLPLFHCLERRCMPIRPLTRDGHRPYCRTGWQLLDPRTA